MLGPRRNVRRRLLLATPGSSSSSPGLPTYLGGSASRRTIRSSNLPFYVLLAFVAGLVALNSLFFLQSFKKVPAHHGGTTPTAAMSSFLLNTPLNSDPRVNALSTQRRRAQKIPTPQNTERQLLFRLTKELQDRWTHCRNHIKPATLKACFPASPPSNLFTALRTYQNETYQAANAPWRHNSSDKTNEQRPSTHCWSPKEGVPMCDLSTYSMLVVVELKEQSTDSVRGLVLNCLKWLLDPGAKEIWILIPKSSQTELLTNEKHREYASRLVQWHSQAHHPVRLVFASTLWEAMSYVSARTEEAAVLWMDGDAPFLGNKLGTQSAFQRWKEEPTGILTPQAWTLSPRSGVSSNTTWKGSKPYQSPCDTASPCRHDTGTIPLIPALHGMIHHSSYLCYLSHTVLKDLRTAAYTWDLARSAISIWMVYVSPVALSTYPFRLSAAQHAVTVTEQRILRPLLSDPRVNNSVVEYPFEVFGDFFGGLPFRRRSDTHTFCT